MKLINDAIVSIVKIMPKPVVGIFSKKYIAGEKLEDAVNLVKQLNSKGIYATLDVLGESIKNKEDAVAAKDKWSKSCVCSLVFCPVPSCMD